jgi:hypothetical protein
MCPYFLLLANSHLVWDSRPEKALARLWHYFGTTLARLWQGFGKALALLWHYFGKALARLWHYFGKALVGGFGKALVRLWQGSGKLEDDEMLLELMIHLHADCPDLMNDKTDLIERVSKLYDKIHVNTTP